MTVLNKARLANPARNQYGAKSTLTKAKRSTDGPPQLLNITTEIAEAAALLANVKTEPNSTMTQSNTMAAGSFWMEGLARKGTVPWGNDPGYKV
jgi:hypothetical protein